MGGENGFDIDLVALRAFADQLNDLAKQAEDLIRPLVSITADTGRSDSDQMGALGPRELGRTLSRLRKAIQSDSANVVVATTNYVAADSRAAGDFSKLNRAT